MTRFVLLLLAALTTSAALPPILPTPTSKAVSEAVRWQVLDHGLQLGEYLPAVKSAVGDSKITVLKIDPRFYTFRLLESLQFHDARKTAAQWCRQQHLVACVNAGMYQPDGHAVGYLRNGPYHNNAVFNQDNALLVFAPADTLHPALKLIDRGCEADWAQQIVHYGACVQSTRMVDCTRKNTWAPQPRQWSAVLWGMDRDGQALLIFCRSPYSMHDLVNLLLQSPLDLQQAMYLEGGPEASLSVHSGNTGRDLFGSYETGFMENDDVRQAFPLPNVIGVVKKQR